ncbi:hypothetical protein J4457_03520 [Candidatus Woesearchaeota archaeon]|nr:hypothetical protein [Candidatus Woesearchaeota archaeon]
MAEEETRPPMSKNTWMMLFIGVIILVLFFSCSKKPETKVGISPAENVSENITEEKQPEVVVPKITGPEVKPVEEVNEPFATLKEALAYNGSVSCTFVIDGVSIQLDRQGKEFKQVAKQGTNELYTLFSNDKLFSWTEQGYGRKLDVKRLEQSGLLENIPEDATEPSAEMADQATELHCSTEPLNASVFVQPNDVEFEDMNAVLEEMAKEPQPKISSR